MSSQNKPNVVTTRWWWVRHAPVRSDGGNIYGQTDIACDTSDREVFFAVAKVLPRNAVWIASNLRRTHQTAEAIWAAGFPRPVAMSKEAAFAEQNLGEWQGMNRAAFLASRPIGSHWFADINEPAPGGESFMDLYRRTTGAIERYSLEHAGKDVIAVAHGGHQGGGRARTRRPAGEGPCLRHRQLFGDAARSFRKHGSFELAASFRESAAMDCGRQPRRDAPAGGAGGYRNGEQARVTCHSGRVRRDLTRTRDFGFDASHHPGMTLNLKNNAGYAGQNFGRET